MSIASNDCWRKWTNDSHRHDRTITNRFALVRIRFASRTGEGVARADRPRTAHGVAAARRRSRARAGRGVHAHSAAAARLGRHGELQVPRDRTTAEAQLEVGRRRHRHRRDVHAHADVVRHAPVARAIRLQAKPEAEPRRRALRLEDDGWEARRPAREDRMNSNQHPADSHDLIRVQGARENNLKDVSVDIPKRRLTVFTGVSGSGKSSLVFSTIAAESQRLINETYSAFLQNFMPTLGRPEVDVLEGLTTAIIVDQERMGANARSTVGTVTDANAMLRVLWSRLGKPQIGPPSAFAFNVPSVRASGDRKSTRL